MGEELREERGRVERRDHRIAELEAQVPCLPREMSLKYEPASEPLHISVK